MRPDHRDPDSTLELARGRFYSEESPLGSLARLTRKEARLGARLARLSAQEGLAGAVAWMGETLGASVEVGQPEVIWKASGLQRAGVVAQLVWSRLATRIGLGVETPVAHALVDRLLGYDRLAEERRLQVTPVEWGVLSMAIAETLRRLGGSPGPLGRWDLHLDRVGPDLFDTTGLGKFVTIRWPVSLGNVDGSIRLWLPEGLVTRWLTIEPADAVGATAHLTTRYPDLAGEWRAEAGTVALRSGMASVRPGTLFPFLETRLRGTAANPTGPVTLSLTTTDRDGRYQIECAPEPDSGLSRFIITSPIEHVATPRGANAMPQSSHQNTPASAAPVDVPVTLVVELGRVNLSLARLADLKSGDVVELGRHSREPVEITSGGRLVARGELVQIDSELGVRVTTVFL